MKILYVTHYDSDNIKLLSGTIYHVRRMLEEQGHEIIVLDNIKIPVIYYKAMKALSKVTKKQTLVERSPFFLKYIARQIERRTAGMDYDLVFSPSSLYYAYYKDKKPMVFYTDATFGGLLNYYFSEESCYSWAVKNAMNQERLALKNADLAIYASQWAVDTAVKFHQADEKKCVVINRGANIKHKLGKEEIYSLIDQREATIKRKKCTFMFLGTDWERKGGPLAVEITKILNKKFGVESKIIIIGCNPQISQEDIKYVDIIGYLDKSQKSEYEKLESIFRKVNFFLLPSRSEAQGISYTEACSWGVPVIASDTGGVSGIVKDGINGFLMSEKSTAREYAERIYKTITTPDEYKKLSKSTFEYCIGNLTWSAVGKKINKELSEVKA